MGDTGMQKQEVTRSKNFTMKGIRVNDMFCDLEYPEVMTG